MKICGLTIVLLLTMVHAQQDSCSCTCCSGQNCSPYTLPPLPLQSCTQDRCVAQCRTSYPQCQNGYPNGVLSAACSSTLTPQYNCRCDCCNTGSSSCTPVFVGNAVGFTCQTGSCSILCSQLYPTQCISNQFGQTQGTCTGQLTTTSTTTTTAGPWLGNSCSCNCCSTGSSCSPFYVGATSASQCSATSCTQACRNQYPATCPSFTSTGQSSGTCTSQGGGSTRCKCNCCGMSGCSDIEVNTSGSCASCESACRQQPQCTNAYQVTPTCLSSGIERSITFSLVAIVPLFCLSCWRRFLD